VKGKSMVHNKRSKDSKDNWRTPPKLISNIEAVLGRFDVDLCATDEDSVAGIFIRDLSEEGAADDLVSLGVNLMWCNPPFSKKNELVPIAIDLAKKTGMKLVILIPAAVETRFWKQHIWSETVLFLAGRLAFGKPDGSKAGNAAFPCALVLVNFQPIEQARLTEAIEANKLVIGAKDSAKLLRGNYGKST
jgi:phage N-6-adenine-methyltransferase